MEPTALLDILSVAERLKCGTRHCFTSSGRPESIAEHSWRLALMALLLRDEFPEVDMNRVIGMCLIHDLGEAFTGDIPAFQKQECHRDRETHSLRNWFCSFPEPAKTEFTGLLDEMEAQSTEEAKIYKALDRLEAVIQHDESDLSTWIPLEYELQFTYGSENVKFSPYLQRLKAEIDRRTAEKISSAGTDAGTKEI